MGSVAESGDRRRTEECDGCRFPYLDFQTDFVTHAGDRLCKRCRAIFWVATILFEQGIEDEAVIFPTLAFAKYATGVPEYDGLVGMQGAVEVPTPADLARMLLAGGMLSSSMLEKAYQGWELLRSVDGVPIIRVLPFSVFAEEHQGTQILKQVRIQVLSKYAEPASVRERYERVLSERGVRWDDSGSGSISHNFLGGFLDIGVRPTAGSIYEDAGNSLGEEFRDLLERYPDYFLRKAYPGAYPSERPDDHLNPYPSPRYIEASYKALRGSLRGTKSTGIAHALDLYGRANKKTAEKAIPAFVAWHLGADFLPAVVRPEIARVLNKHLLVPCGKAPLPEDGWKNDDTVWRDSKVLSERFERLHRAGTEKPLDKPVF